MRNLRTLALLLILGAAPAGCAADLLLLFTAADQPAHRQLATGHDLDHL